MPKKLDVTEVELAAVVWRSAADAGDDQPGRVDGTGRNRVEIARLPGGVAVRDSDRPIGPVLLFTSDEWDAFLAGLHDGEFDGATA